MERNPLIEPENYFEGYQKSIESLKNNPQLIEFEKLTYEMIEGNPSGKQWMELVVERYLIPALVAKGNPTYQLDVIWQEGFKDFPRLMQSLVKSHKQRISAGQS